MELPQEEIDAMTKAQEEFWAEEEAQRKKDEAVLETIKSQVSEKLFKLIQDEIKECDNTYDFGIVDEHEGEYQEHKDEIRIWITQCYDC